VTSEKKNEAMENPFAALDIRLTKLEQHTQEILRILKDHSNRESHASRIPIRVKTAAKILSLSESTIRTKAWKGEIPSIKRGKYLYFFENDLLNFLKEGVRKSNQQIRDEVDNIQTHLQTETKQQRRKKMILSI